MPYSFTEKKRIRKSFAKREDVQSVPYLLATQLESYLTFLQEETLGGSTSAKNTPRSSLRLRRPFSCAAMHSCHVLDPG